MRSDRRYRLLQAAMTFFALCVTLSLTLSGQAYDMVVTMTSESGAAEFLSYAWVTQGVLICWLALPIIDDWILHPKPTPVRADKAAAATSQVSLKHLVTTLEGRADAKELRKLVKRLKAMQVLYAGFADSKTADAVKSDVNRQISDLVASVQNYCRQLDVPYLEAYELTDNLEQLIAAVEGCTSLLRTHLRTVNAVVDSDVQSTNAKLAALSEVEKM